jgi:serine/threonine-protein kinase
MVQRLFECDPDRLRSYLDDELSDGDQVELADHLNHCVTCQRTLERLAAGSGLWRELRSLGDPSGSPMAAFSPDDPRTRWQERPRRAAGGEGLAFLTPSENPAYLGRLGPYEVTGVLGEGGMGVVLKAFDPSLSRVVAIKVLAPQMAASGAARRRFFREAKAAAAVVHEHVVAIYAVDTDSNCGLPYLVMPYIAGRSLQERIDRDGPLRTEEVLRIGMQTALGLAAAHSQGLVHRDIKPSNILLENGLERVRITDFGLARAVDDASQSQSGVVAGTPQYMSPEQARGETVDHRADLFSLGSVLYAMCAGHSPFRAKTMMGVLRRVCDEAPRPLVEINPEVPEELEGIIERLHAKDPDRRYQSASEVAEVLGQSLARLQRPDARCAARRPRGTSLESDKGARSIAAVAKTAAAAGAKKPRPRILSLAAAALLVVFGLAVAGTTARLAILPPADAAGARADSPGAGEGAGTGQGGRPANVIITGQDESQTIVGSGKPATKRWDLADFTAVAISHPFQAEITRGDRFEVAVTADDNVLEHVQVAKEGQRLRVGLEDGRTYRLRRDALKIAIAMPALELLDLSHGARAAIRGFESHQPFQGKAHHGSLLEGTIGAGRIELDTMHGSTIALRGSAETARLAAAHGSTLRLDGLAIQDTELRVHHGSTAIINAKPEKALKAEAHHGSTLNGIIQGGDVDLEAAHGSRVALSGSAQRARIAGNHSSRLALAELTLDAAVVRLDQGSSATINAKSKLDYHLSHSSQLRYRGSPGIGQSNSSHGSSARALRDGDDQPADEKQKAAEAAPEPGQDQRGPAGSASARSREDGSESITINLNFKGNGTGSIIVGSGKPATKTVDVKDFTGIQIERMLAADVTRADSFKVSLTADDNVLDRIEVVRQGSTLRISLAPGGYLLREKPHVSITLPALEGIDIAGAARATIQGFESDRPFRARISGASTLEGSIRTGDVDLAASGASTLRLRGSAHAARLVASGASKLELAELPVSGEKLMIAASGASSARLRGSARAAVLQAEGASRLDLTDLALEGAEVVLAGASRATIQVKGLLNYDLSSASRLEYLGEPTIGKAKRAGASSVAQRRPGA